MTRKIVQFFHGTRTDSEESLLESFRREGALATGHGTGGQAKGFFVFGKEDEARKYAVDYGGDISDASTETGQPGPGQRIVPAVVKIATEFSPAAWDFDYELEPNRVIRLLGGFKPQLTRLQGQYIFSRDIRLPGGAPGKHDLRIDNVDAEAFAVTYGFDMPPGLRPRPQGNRKQMHFAFDKPYRMSDPRACAALQIVTDFMAGASPEFRQAKYDALTAAAHEGSAALKYVGDSPLKIAAIDRYDGAVWRPASPVDASFKPAPG